MFNTIETYIQQLDTKTIAEERKGSLLQLAEYIQKKQSENTEINLNFICTHNSRRSQFSQVWAHTLACYYNININCFSSGTEATACNERTIASLRRTGFDVQKNESGNPKYSLDFGNDSSIIAFSKVYDDTSILQPFAAIMTCSHAEANCPFIPSAEVRIPIRFEDPKAFDDTPQEAEMYDARSKQIATEIKFVFEKVKNS